MSVILNEAVLRELLDTQEGPVGIFVEKLAARVVDTARGNIRDYFHGAGSLTVEQNVDAEMEGSSAVIGIRPGSKAELMARRQAEGRVNWLVSALQGVHD